MQKHVNRVDLVKSFPTNIFLQNLASIQQRTTLIKFDQLDEKSEKGPISNLSTKVGAAARALRGLPGGLGARARAARGPGRGPERAAGAKGGACRGQPSRRGEL